MRVSLYARDDDVRELQAAAGLRDPNALAALVVDRARDLLDLPPEQIGRYRQLDVRAFLECMMAIPSGNAATPPTVSTMVFDVVLITETVLDTSLVT